MNLFCLFDARVLEPPQCHGWLRNSCFGLLINQTSFTTIPMECGSRSATARATLSIIPHCLDRSRRPNAGIRAADWIIPAAALGTASLSSRSQRGAPAGGASRPRRSKVPGRRAISSRLAAAEY